MSRRSNSLLLPSPDDDDPAQESLASPPPSPIIEELVIEELEMDAPAPLATQSTSPLALAGRAADQAAGKNAFARYQARLSPNSRLQQEATLAAWHQYLTSAGLRAPAVDVLMSEATAWAEVTWGLVEGFSQWLLQEGYAIATVNVRLSTIRTYCRLAHKVGVLDQGQYSRIRLVQGYTRKDGRNIDRVRAVTRVGDKKAEWVRLTDHQADELRAQLTDSPQGRRDRVLMCLLLDHGLRCGEVAALQIEDFDLARGIFAFYREKVDKVQIHRLTHATQRALELHLCQDLPSQGPLLRGSRKDGSLTETAMSQRSITRRVQVLGKAIGIAKLSAHDCRHYWATDAAESGTGVKELQDAGGWSSPAMALHYIASQEIANEGLRQGKGKKR